MRVLTLVWLSIVVVNLTVWGIVSLTVDEPVHPWWLWVAGADGIGAGRALRGGHRPTSTLIRHAVVRDRRAHGSSRRACSVGPSGRPVRSNP